MNAAQHCHSALVRKEVDEINAMLQQLEIL